MAGRIDNFAANDNDSEPLSDRGMRLNHSAPNLTAKEAEDLLMPSLMIGRLEDRFRHKPKTPLKNTLQTMPVKAYKTGKDAVVVVTKPVLHTTKSFTESFKTFVESRNIVEVAVAFVMGLAFREICTALVSDIFGPLIGLVIPIDDVVLSEQFFVIRTSKNGSDDVSYFATRQQAKDAGAITINWGHFLKVVFDFLLLCLVLYMFINFFYLKLITKPTVTNPCPHCLEKTKEGAARCPHCTQPIAAEKAGKT